MQVVDHSLSALLVLPVVLLAARLRWLSVSGAVAAFVVGWVTIAAGGWQAASVLLAFFITSSALSRWRAERKRRMESLTARGARRGAVQVFANGGVATLCVALYGVTGDAHWWLAFAGAYAAANADTWSSEVGMLSRTPPRHILTGRLLQAGDSGGVTPVGLLAGCAGSAIVAGAAWLVYPVPLQQALAVALGGIAGNLLDSVLGGTLQARYRCVRCGEAVERREHCGSPAQHIAGWRRINNDVVNLLCTLAGALVGFIVARI